MAIVVKYYILLALPLNALVGSILSLSVMANYLALLSHAADVTEPTKDGVVRQLWKPALGRPSTTPVEEESLAGSEPSG